MYRLIIIYEQIGSTTNFYPFNSTTEQRLEALWERTIKDSSVIYAQWDMVDIIDGAYEMQKRYIRNIK